MRASAPPHVPAAGVRATRIPLDGSSDCYAGSEGMAPLPTRSADPGGRPHPRFAEPNRINEAFGSSVQSQWIQLCCTLLTRCFTLRTKGLTLSTGGDI